MFHVHCQPCLLACIACLAAALHTQQPCNGAVPCSDMDEQHLKHYTLEAFAHEYKRNYTPGTSEWSTREKIFQTNLHKLILMRANAKSWTPGVTMFMDYDNHEYSKLLGYKGRRARSRDTPLVEPTTNEVSELSSVKLPPFVNTAMNKVLTRRVKDQGSCGSCWAVAAVATLEGVVETWDPSILRTMASATTGSAFGGFGMYGGYRYGAWAGPAQRGLSTQAVTACTPNKYNCGGSGGCDGATAELAYSMVKQYGLPLESVYPYTSGANGETGTCNEQSFSKNIPRIGISGYTTLPRNQFMPLKSALAQRGHPIAVAVDASNWNFYMRGIYSDTEGGKAGDFTVNHEVTLIGYTEKQREGGKGYYLIKNSWGPQWGEQGFIRIEMKDLEEFHCGWDKDTHVGLACDGQPNMAWVCGTCGILYDSVYPTGIHLFQ